jgi:hypothetical protein
MSAAEPSPADQEWVEQILAVRCPEAETFLDLDAEGLDLMTARLGRVYDVILCLGPAFTSLRTRDELQAAFRTFAAHARFDTQLIVRRPAHVHQAVLEWRAKPYRFGLYGSSGDLLVFSYGFDTRDKPDSGGF